jgi:hypothetical protein
MGFVLSEYMGIGQFGPAYEFMLRNDCHAPGSVDRVLMDRMVRLCGETADYVYAEHTPTEARYDSGSRPELEAQAREATRGCASVERRIEAIARFCSRLGERAPQGLDSITVGGTEEEIISRGCDWCTEVARAACALYQVAGFPCRLAFLADTDKAYSGHAIVEVYRRGVWGAVDSTTNVVYRHRSGGPATTWDLMNDQQLVEAHGPAPYTNPGQFRCAAIANYFVWESSSYDYTAGGLNSYYRSILEMSLQRWPGGLRWLHGEDGMTRAPGHSS